MKKNNFKTSLFLFLLIGVSSSLFSQSISINSTGASPSSNAVLDLNTGNSNNRGLIIPHVKLSALGTFNPPIANAKTTKDTGMIVYNTNASIGSGVGYYSWSGSTWVSTVGLSAIDSGGGSGKIAGSSQFLTQYSGKHLQGVFYTNYSTLGGTLPNVEVDLASYPATILSQQTSCTMFGYAVNGYSGGKQWNTAIGYVAMNQSGAVNGCTAVGCFAGYGFNSSYNTAIGYEAGGTISLYHGQACTYIGYLSGSVNKSLANQCYLGDSIGTGAFTAVKFAGALMPYYSSNYQAGTTGQVLTSQGAGLSPQWTTKSNTYYSHTIFTPTTGGAVTLVDNQYNIINPSDSLATLTVTLPSSPSNNDVVIIKFTKVVMAVTYSGGTVVSGISTPMVGTLETLSYDSGTASWY